MKIFEKILPPLRVGVMCISVTSSFYTNMEAARTYFKTRKSAYQRRKARKEIKTARSAHRR